MARITVTVCDHCERQEGVLTYELRAGEEKKRVDLCVQCAKPLERIFKPGRQPQTRQRKTRKNSPNVTTMDEIEQLKK